MFWLDEALCSDLYLDGVVTVVDCKFCCKQITHENEEKQNTHFEFSNQIALADVVLLNKIDLVDKKTLEESLERVKTINSSAQLYETSYGNVELDKILDLHAYDTGALTFNRSSNVKGHLASSITTCTFYFDGILNEDDLDRVLENILWTNDETDSGDNKQRILRLKGIVNLDIDSSASYQIQAVYDIFDKYKLPNREDTNKIIVIGHHLNHDLIKKQFNDIQNLK